jgi:hypothetical protein
VCAEFSEAVSSRFTSCKKYRISDALTLNECHRGGRLSAEYCFRSSWLRGTRPARTPPSTARSVLAKCSCARVWPDVRSGKFTSKCCRRSPGNPVGREEPTSGSVPHFAVAVRSGWRRTAAHRRARAWWSGRIYPAATSTTTSCGGVSVSYRRRMCRLQEPARPQPSSVFLFFGDSEEQYRGPQAEGQRAPGTADGTAPEAHGDGSRRQASAASSGQVVRARLLW